MKIALVMTPKWLETTPPIAIGLLLGSVKHAGYEAKGFDYNVASWYYAYEPQLMGDFKGYYNHDIPSTSEMKKGWDSEDWWGYTRQYQWIDESKFKKFVVPKFKELWDAQIEELLNYDPDVYGFNLNNTNYQSLWYMLKAIKKKKPDVPVIVGGSSCADGNYWLRQTPEIDVVVSGEGEYVLLELLNNYKTTGLHGEVKNICVRDQTGHPYAMEEGDRKLKREDFDNLPFPNYDDFPMEMYRTPGEVAIQGSRGCVAKCTFCFETNYWRNWRQKSASTLHNEMKTMNKKYGAKSFHYVDSLINGDVKLLEELCDRVLADPEIENFKFFGYARVHRLQTRELLAKFSKAGIRYMSYGIESGSNSVLKSMKKGTNRNISSQNLRDSALEGIYTHANLIVGYPTETTLDYLQSLIFIYNNRFYFTEISPGPTLGMQELTELQVNPFNFNMGFDLLNEWYTKDFKNTIIHRLFRLKCLLIWLDLLDIVNAYSSDIKDHWSFEHKNTKIQTWSTFNINATDFLSYFGNVGNHKTQMKNMPETFTTLPYFEEIPDFFYELKPKQFTGELWEKTIRAEIIAFVWLLYTTFGECKFKGSFDQENDPFPDWYRHPYIAIINFDVDKNGEFKLEIKHELKHVNSKRKPLTDQPIQCEPFNNDIVHTGNIKNKGLDDFYKICDPEVFISIQNPKDIKEIKPIRTKFSTMTMKEKRITTSKMLGWLK